MKLRSVKEIKNLKGKRVLLRADFNVPLDSRGRITDDFKIKAGLATINYLLKKKASV
ncbi:MAG: phosphoglycerate kinase, partial [Candidatus Komeilibacteria bacterium CG10_big_fil_rev_8_21_14_0_10_41_13]